MSAGGQQRRDLAIEELQHFGGSVQDDGTPDAARAGVSRGKQGEHERYRDHGAELHEGIRPKVPG
jgi:hypothetical protein